MTATTNHSNRTSQRSFLSLFFGCFFFVVLLRSSTKIDLVYLLGLQLKLMEKAIAFRYRPFLGLRLKLTKKVTAFHCFQTAPLTKKLFCFPFHKHTILAPGQPLTIQCGLSKRKSLLWCQTVFLIF